MKTLKKELSLEENENGVWWGVKYCLDISRNSEKKKACRNMNSKQYSNDLSVGNERNVIQRWGKGHFSDKVTKNLNRLPCSRVVSNEIG